MYSGERQQFLCLAGYQSLCLRLRAFHSTTGKRLWHEEIPIPLSGQVGALVVSDGVLYLTYWNGSIVAIDATTRRICTGKCYRASVRGNVLYLVVTLHLLALDSHTGELHWSYEHESIHDHPRYQSITLLEHWDHLLTCQRTCGSEHDSYDSSLYRLSALDRATVKLLRVVKGGHVCEGHPPTFFTSFQAAGGLPPPLHLSLGEMSQPLCHEQAGWQRTLVNTALLR